MSQISTTRTAALYVKASYIHGRGVFAGHDYAPEDIIEVCEMLVVPIAQRAQLDGTVLFDYYFEWQGDAALALGLGSLYNHSYHPNAVYGHDLQDTCLTITAYRAISAGQEITVNYNRNPTDQAPLWFPVKV